ncbi:hypothetical protein GBO17_17055 [Mycobacterium avium subsp. hominissuis]|nr:hypothetical protein [Mycobacterium avium subsp. hominissuis]MBZ4570167.1 hypothetical protein [Mycobacterium avium subsp. hominissuis]MBZ4589615.1 hypothetical protein [Mycobacterium avium subsp. hominissuis]MBZ4626053.1 hypothetical protein [Mycobacterium avium subsp. hominissuis]
MSGGITISQRLEQWAKLTDYTLTPGSSTRDGRPYSFTGRDVSAEQEILFPAHTRFLVLRKTVDPRTGRTIIDMVEDSRLSQINAPRR